MKNPPEMQQQQQADIENMGVTQDCKPVPIINGHVTGVVTPTDSRAQDLDHLKTARENVTTARAIHALHIMSQKNVLYEKVVLIICSPIYLE